MNDVLTAEELVAAWHWFRDKPVERHKFDGLYEGLFRVWLERETGIHRYAEIVVHPWVFDGADDRFFRWFCRRYLSGQAR